MNIKQLFTRNKAPDTTTQVGLSQYAYNSEQAHKSLLDYFNRGGAEEETNSVVFRCIRLICDAISCLNLELFEQDENGYGTQLYKYNGVKLLSGKSNKFQSTSTIISILVYDIIMKGEGIIEIFRDKQGNPIELRNTAFYTTKKKNNIYDLVYEISDDYGTRLKDSKDVIHVKANSKDGITGRSLFIYASNVLNIQSNIDTYIKAYFKNGYFSNGYLTTEKALTDKQFSQLKSSWGNYSGASNAGKTPLLDNGLKYMPIMIRPSETNVVEIKKQMASDVARFFGVPLGKLNMLDNTVLDKDENRKFFDETLQPYINNIEQEFSNKLFTRPSQENLYIKFNVRKYTYVSNDIALSYGTQIHNGMITPNEARKEQNRPPLEGGDDLYMNYIKLINNDAHFGDNEKNDEKKKE